MYYFLFLKLYPSWSNCFFFCIMIKKRFVLWSNTLLQSFHLYCLFMYTRAFITSFFEESFPKVGTFIRIIWHNGINRSGQKWSGEWYTDWWIRFQNKDKNISIAKTRFCYFFCAVYHSKNHVILQPDNAAIFDVILNILQHSKSNNNMLVKFFKFNRKWSGKSYLLEIDFRFNFAFKWRPSWTPSSIIQPSKSNQSFILSIVILSLQTSI